MNRNDELQWLILGFGLSWPDDDLSRRTNISGLWKEAKRRCFDCERNELWDALYTLSREQAALIKCVSAGEGFHPISFERVRNTSDWTHYFLIGDFGVKVLHERRARYRELSEQLRKATPTHSGWVTRGAHSWRRSAGFRLAENYRFVRLALWALSRGILCKTNSKSHPKRSVPGERTARTPLSVPSH
jgi:hypothetical protein